MRAYFQELHQQRKPRNHGTCHILQTYYQGMDKVKTSKLQILRRDFETLSMKDTNTVDSFYTHVIELINQIKSHSETIEDKKLLRRYLGVFLLSLILFL
jgi:hypothetical protein